LDDPAAIEAARRVIDEAFRARKSESDFVPPDPQEFPEPQKGEEATPAASAAREYRESVFSRRNVAIDISRVPDDISALLASRFALKTEGKFSLTIFASAPNSPLAASLRDIEYPPTFLRLAAVEVALKVKGLPEDIKAMLSANRMDAKVQDWAWQTIRGRGGLPLKLLENIIEPKFQTEAMQFLRGAAVFALSARLWPILNGLIDVARC
jgi:hypothetical protein